MKTESGKELIEEYLIAFNETGNSEEIFLKKQYVDVENLKTALDGLDMTLEDLNY